MKSNRIYEDLFPIIRRANGILFLVKIIFIFLILSFWKVQILDHEKYWQKSEANRIREIALPSQRGLILDRNGKILADNRGSFKVSIIRENCKDLDKSCRRVARLLKIDEGVLKERIKKYESLPLFKPIVVKENLSLEEVIRIEARKLEFPELILQTEPKRFYPFGNLAAHVIGYIQELSPQDIENGLYEKKRLGDLVGRTGVEKEFEPVLAGRDGKLLEVVDSLGRARGEVSKQEPGKGKDLTLTLDFDLQKKAEELLEGKEGAIIVLDPRTGEILALASYPTYDPNRFINRFTSEEWIGIVNSPVFPLENRAIRGLYSPGSVFKLTMALGALDLGLINDRTSFFCSGTIRIYGQTFSCWAKSGHGSMNLYNGIRNSCNIFFYQLGKMMDIEKISYYAEMLGFGKKTGIDLIGEKEGLVPNSVWKEKVKNEPWQPGETISVSIGQGPLLVTPIQIAAQTALIANRGQSIKPYLVKSGSQQKEGSMSQALDSESDRVKIDPSNFEKVIRGMWEGVNNEGTGRAAKVDQFDVCGKTGSTQLMSQEKIDKIRELGKEIKTHSWFTGFAPKDHPEVVVTVLVEYGGMGGATAAPIARQLFELYRENNGRQKSSGQY
jgi:penicillin-binding protein 2